ncbi:MAG: polymerase III protein [Candidatus Moranbacteria bacterium GW2011_GWE2_35_2-]|nr:MAG: polymerase III protein [Candidatus Moranbacteria bacterium GW2011_GWE2_35_2-]KKQ06184.1 MAG: polymerase III protein [Candidatus Moranbacteria bacterium GW2011_GWF1_36_4]KKQ22277.1 MAG: polymerase III protein [Candidatus Moranbacteria bacterium GW2011_GWF2_37_11]KKQ28505.1 MAG: polymerase III protein [Candidatus Moranbacteria bacterium GW2011_GWD1_37_17]KKQ30231.1 MAG: polymerase III protein [Candidatus Moranbacteria bacterium GW2011_GWE1_37_24]KKQ47622.1 MAG: polymerase III protein [Ca
MIIFLYGDDDFRSGEKLAEIKIEFLKKNGSGTILSVFDFEDEAKENVIADVLSARGLFGDKKIVIVKNLMVDGKTEKQVNILEILNKIKYLEKDEETLLIFWEKGLPRKNGKLFKYIFSVGKVESFEKLSTVALENWIKDRVKKANGKISSEAEKKLIAYVGNDLFLLGNEIEKLVNYTKEIEEEHIDLLTNSKIESDIFQTIESLVNGNKKDAINFLHRQLEKGDDPFYIFSMYVYQFRNLLKIAGLYFSGLSNEYAIAKETKLHPFVVKKGLAQVRMMDIKKIKSIYRNLAEIDLKVKTGKIDINLALDKFVVEL